ncbi:MAG: hypothetical protein SF053_03570 [Bacteroidia bacterium]|nr:hypothetical protein [Bacteroidia bacterium]
MMLSISRGARRMIRFASASVMSLLLALSACEEAVPFEVIPQDGPPAITVTAPANPRFLKRPGEQTTVTFQLGDNEGLRLFRVVPRIYNEADSLIGDALPQDFDLTGNSQPFTYTFTAPALNPYYKIQYNCYAIDLKGAYATTSFWLSILPDPAAPQPYRILTYTSDTVYNKRKGIDYAFNFTSRASLPTTPGQNLDPLRLQMDIAEGSGSQTAWLPYLNSPANEQLGLDSVFVMTDATRFNYESANYTTIYQAFFADPAPATRTPVLKEGDYVIVRLIKSPRPQFAVMKVTKLFFDGAGINVSDYVVFDYKVTTP